MNSLQDSIEYGLRKLGYDKIKDNLIVILSAVFLIWASTKKRYSDTGTGIWNWNRNRA